MAPTPSQMRRIEELTAALGKLARRYPQCVAGELARLVMVEDYRTVAVIDDYICRCAASAKAYDEAAAAGIVPADPADIDSRGHDASVLQIDLGAGRIERRVDYDLPRKEDA